MINNGVNTGFQVAELKPRTAANTQSTAARPAPAEGAATTDKVSPIAPATPSEEKPAAATSPELQEAVTKLNDYVQNIRRTLSFTIEESTGNTVISVYDAETDELIRQIPPEETIKLAEAIEQQNAARILKERA